MHFVENEMVRHENEYQWTSMATENPWLRQGLKENRRSWWAHWSNKITISRLWKHYHNNTPNANTSAPKGMQTTNLSFEAWILGNRANFQADRGNDKKLLAKALYDGVVVQTFWDWKMDVERYVRSRLTWKHPLKKILWYAIWNQLSLTPCCQTFLWRHTNTILSSFLGSLAVLSALRRTRWPWSFFFLKPRHGASLCLAKSQVNQRDVVRMIRVEIYNTRCLVSRIDNIDLLINYKWVLQWLIRLAHAWSVSSSDGKPSCFCRRQTEPRNTRVMTAKLNDGRAVENGRLCSLCRAFMCFSVFVFSFSRKKWNLQNLSEALDCSGATHEILCQRAYWTSHSGGHLKLCLHNLLSRNYCFLHVPAISIRYHDSVYRSADSFTVHLGTTYDSASVITSRFDQDYLLILFRSLPFVLPLLDCEASCLIRAHRTWHGQSRRPKPAHWDQRIFLNFSGGWYNDWSTCLQFVWSDTNERSGQNKLQVVGGGVRNLGKSCFALVIPVTATICSGLTVLQGGLAGWFILGWNCCTYIVTGFMCGMLCIYNVICILPCCLTGVS